MKKHMTYIKYDNLTLDCCEIPLLGLLDLLKVLITILFPLESKFPFMLAKSSESFISGGEGMESPLLFRGRIWLSDAVCASELL